MLISRVDSVCDVHHCVLPGVNLRPYLTVEAFVSRLALFTRWSVGAILSVQLLCLGLKEAKPVLPGVVIVGSESVCAVFPAFLSMLSDP